MGQQVGASGTWRSQNKPTSQDSYETMGQQNRQTNLAHRAIPAMEPDHVKNSKSRFETGRKIPSENERKSSDFAPYGMAVIRLLVRQHRTRFQVTMHLSVVAAGGVQRL